MEKRIFTLILVVVIGVLVGVGIVSKQGRESLLHDVLKGQNAMFKAQKNLAKNITSGGGAIQGSSVAVLVQKLSAMEIRITALEAKITSLQGARQQKGSGGNVGQGPPPENLSTVYNIGVDHSYIRGNKKCPDHDRGIC